jgi:hypothetical protein
MSSSQLEFPSISALKSSSFSFSSNKLTEDERRCPFFFLTVEGDFFGVGGGFVALGVYFLKNEELP